MKLFESGVQNQNARVSRGLQEGTPALKLSLICILLLFAGSLSAQKSFKTSDYYPLADGNEWRYVAPPGWKDGDYISRIVLAKYNFASTHSINPLHCDFSPDSTSNTFKHYDATKAAKLLRIENGNIYHVGEEMAGRKSYVWFEKPILWLESKLRIGKRLDETRGFTQYFSDGKSSKGKYRITQRIAKREAVETTAGKFRRALRIESETFWELGDGRKARSENVFHYVKKVGVVKASARFVIISKEGKELINRLVETDLKNAKIGGKWLFRQGVD